MSIICVHSIIREERIYNYDVELQKNVDDARIVIWEFFWGRGGMGRLVCVYCMYVCGERGEGGKEVLHDEAAVIGVW